MQAAPCRPRGGPCVRRAESVYDAAHPPPDVRFLLGAEPSSRLFRRLSSALYSRPQETRKEW